MRKALSTRAVYSNCRSVVYVFFFFQVLSMIADVRDTFIRNIDHLDWMDDKTKAYAKEKVNRLLSCQSIFRTADTLDLSHWCDI